MTDDGGGMPVRFAGAGGVRRNLPFILVAGAILVVLDFWTGGRGVVAAAGILCLVSLGALQSDRSSGNGEAASDMRKGSRTDAGLSAAELAGAINDPIYFLDQEGTVLYSNGAARDAFGPLAVGSAFQLKFRSPEMQVFVRDALRNRSETFVDYVERIPMERVYRVSARVIGEGGKRFVIHFRDQSEARRIDRMRADFIANASHELRTPLASISGFIETMRGPARSDPKAQEQFLQIMHVQTRRMARLIDDLLTLSRIEAKPFGKPTEPVDLRPLVAGVCDTLRQIADEAGVTIEIEFPDGPFEVAGFRDELVQVFENLVSNACKYGRDGKRVIVQAKVEADGEKTVSVTDFGPGIAEEHLPRLTERFYRVESGGGPNQQGTGLGLAIVKHILNRHGGRLTIRSRPGEGSSFTVHFPRPDF